MKDFEELLKKLEASKRAVEKGVQKGVYKAGLLIEGDAKQICAVDTGLLRASINTKSETKDTKTVANVGTNVEYAPYIEFGTGQQGDTSVPHNTSWKGMPPQPFLRPALDHNVNSGNVDLVIKEEIRKELRKI